MNSQQMMEEIDRLARLCEAKDAENKTIAENAAHIAMNQSNYIGELQAQIAMQAEAMKNLIEDVEVTKEARSNFLNFRRYAKHDSDCPKPRCDQACVCGYSSFKFNMDMLLDSCEGYENRSPIDKARQALSATSETVAAWRAKETEPLQREVAMLRKEMQMMLLPVPAEGTTALDICKTISARAEKILLDTQATALAYEREVKAKALEEFGEKYRCVYLIHRGAEIYVGPELKELADKEAADIRASKGE